MTERYTKAMLWNFDGRFPHDVLSTLDAFSIFNLDNIPTNTISSEFSVNGGSEINVLSNHFLPMKKKIRTLLLKNGKVLNLISCQ